MVALLKTYRQSPATDRLVKLPWSRGHAINLLASRDYCRLIRAYETARELGPKTVIVRDASGNRWLVRVARSDRFSVIWQSV
jgi:hypothetical protein